MVLGVGGLAGTPSVWWDLGRLPERPRGFLGRGLPFLPTGGVSPPEMRARDFSGAWGDRPL